MVRTKRRSRYYAESSSENESANEITEEEKSVAAKTMLTTPNKVSN